MTLITIIMPTYNQAIFLAEAVQSVIEQAYLEWELIVVDNYSSDHTNEVILSFKDSRIRYVRFANSGVIAASRNYGLSLAKGEFIAFLDSDDIWRETKLSSALRELSSAKDFVCTNLEVFGIGSPSSILRGFLPEQVNLDPFDFILRSGNFVSTSTVVVRRSLLGSGFNIDPKIVTAEDMDLWLRIFRDKSVRCSYTKEPLTKYRMHSGSSSSQIDRHLHACIEVIRFWFKYCDLPIEQYRQRKSKLYFEMARKLQRQEKKMIALPYLLRSIWINPLQINAWIGLALTFIPKVQKILDLRSN